MSIDSAVLEVLKNASVEGQHLYLPPTQLDRKLYEGVNEVLTRLGGKWKGGKTKAHVFPADPSDLLLGVIGSGEMPPKNPFAFFATPSDLAAGVVAIAKNVIGDLSGKDILEPSIGTGAIALEVRRQFPTADITGVEIDEFRASVSRGKGFEVFTEDFLAIQPSRWLPFDVVLMNPPFSVEGDKTAYITHIDHAMKFLNPGGVLVAIVPPGFTFRTDKKHKAFAEFVGENFRENGDRKFEGTTINTFTVWTVKS